LSRQMGEPSRLTDDQWTEFFDRLHKVNYEQYI